MALTVVLSRRQQMIMHNDCLPRAQSIYGIIENPNVGHGGYHRKFLSAKGGALCARKKTPDVCR